MDDMYRRTRRYGVGRTVLDTLAGVFLLCSVGFWGALHWQVFAVSFANIPQLIVAVVMTLVYSLATPLLLSMLVPTTPGGQLLQKTQWRTVGFPVIVASAALLGYHAFNLMLLWFSAQPAIAEAGQARAYALCAAIGFVVIPALCWVQVTPERWIREVEQAHHVKKLELEQRGEIAIIRARLLWAEQKAAVSYAKLLPAEQQEVRDTLRGLLMGIADTQRSIARTMGIQGDIERSIMGDAEIADSLDYVSQQLERPAASIDKALTYFDDHNREREEKLDRAYEPAHVNQASQRLETRQTVAAPRSAAPRYAAEYETANQRLERFFTVRQVAGILGDMPERTARDIVDAWHAQGWVEQGNIRGQWHFTE